MLEARDRVGGRVWSRELENGAVVEMGAEFILPRTRPSARRRSGWGSDLLDKGMSYGRRELRGADPFEPEDLDAAVAEIERATGAGEGDGLSARELVDRLEMPRGRPRGPRGANRGLGGAPADTVGSAAWAWSRTSTTFPPPASRAATSASRSSWPRRLGDAVRLGDAGRGDRLERRRGAGPHGRRRGGGRRLRDRGPGERDRRDRLRAGAAGAARGGARAAISYGHAAKLFVPLRAPRAAQRRALAFPSRYWAWTANGGAGEVQPVACASPARRRPSSALGVAEGPRRWAASLAELRPDLDLDLRASLLSDLGRRPLDPRGLLVWRRAPGRRDRSRPGPGRSPSPASTRPGRLARADGGRAAQRARAPPGLDQLGAKRSRANSRNALAAGECGASERQTRLIGSRARGRRRAEATSGPAACT